MKRFSILTVLAILVWACSPGTSEDSPAATKKSARADDGRGIGEITSVKLNDPLDAEMIKRGNAIYDMKCAACHKLKGTRVVGPSWSGITSRRKPEWIMNMITNVEVMLEEDPAAQKLLEECLTRMPNQNVTLGDARDVLEFMYQNDASNGQ